MHVTPDGWLVHDLNSDPRVRHATSTRQTTLIVPRPVGIVWHTTGDRSHDLRGTPETLTGSILGYNRARDPHLSWHLFVGRDGSLCQTLPFTAGAWHCMRPRKFPDRYIDNLDRATIAIMLENSGRLLASPDGDLFAWPHFRRGPAGEVDRTLGFDPDRRIEGGIRKGAVVRGGGEAGGVRVEQAIWHDFPAAQVRAAGLALGALRREFGLLMEACALAHSDQHRGVSDDPGDLWMQRVLPALLG